MPQFMKLRKTIILTLSFFLFSLTFLLCNLFEDFAAYLCCPFEAIKKLIIDLLFYLFVKF